MTARLAGLAAAAVLALSVSPLTGHAEVPPLMAAHVAVYDMRLKSANDRSGITDATGRMVVEVQGSDCEGWTVNFRSVNQFVTREGNDTRLIDTQSSSWESGDGKSMRYSQRQLIDNHPDSADRVAATRGSNGKTGEGQLISAGKKPFSLPADVIFPVEHQKRLMAAAVSGRRRDQSRIYDGSEGTKFYTAITFIGDRHTGSPISVPEKDSSELANAPWWPVTVSYYDDSSDQVSAGTPSHQIIMEMYANGIARGVVLDYGDFALEGRLVHLKISAPAACH